MFLIYYFVMGARHERWMLFWSPLLMVGGRSSTTQAAVDLSIHIILSHSALG